MKIKSITLDDSEMPELITAEITRDEAIVLALMMGRYSSSGAADDFGSRYECTSTIYEALVSGVFNRFWDDGVSGAA